MMFEKISAFFSSKGRLPGDELHQVHLRSISLDQKPYPSPDPDTIFCINVHEDKNGLAHAIEYAREVYRPKAGREITFSPRVFALVDIRKLTPQERSQVNTELIPAGASIFRYPRDCNSFEQAMNALKEHLLDARERYQAARINASNSNTESGANSLTLKSNAAGQQSASLTATAED